MIDSCSSHFADEVRRDAVLCRTYLGRLILRTHQPEDTTRLASIYSDEVSRKHLTFLQPPRGWTEGHAHQWTEENFNERVQVQNETRAKAQSCVLNLILLDMPSDSHETLGRCIGTTGFVRIDGRTAYLGIIMDRETTRRGLATEALHASIVFAFEKLGAETIVMQTSQKNEEMRGWCEQIAQLQVTSKKETQLNGHTFIQCEYSFSFEQWNKSIKQRLESKMDALSNRLASSVQE